MIFEQYEPDEVSFSFANAIIRGFQEGTFIDAERDSDDWTDHAGALGDVTRVRNLDARGKITLTLMAQSPSNDLLNALYQSDKATGLGFGPIQILDHNGLMEVHASIAWIRKAPKIDRAKEAGSCVWVFACADIEIIARGNVTP